MFDLYCMCRRVDSGGFFMRFSGGKGKRRPRAKKADSAAEKQAAEKAQREWQNFLDYDGTAQEPIK